MPAALGFVAGLAMLFLGVALFRAKDPPMTSWSAPPKVMAVMFILIGLGMALSALFVDQPP